MIHRGVFASIPASAPPWAARRAVVHAIAALVGAGALLPVSTGWAQTSATLDTRAFANLVRGLTGFAYSESVASEAMRLALLRVYSAADLASLASAVTLAPPSDLGPALKAAGLDKLGLEVLTALYTGSVEGPKGNEVVTYTAALAWQACAFTKPNAWCGGSTGYWTDPPAGIRS